MKNKLPFLVSLLWIVQFVQPMFAQELNWNITDESATDCQVYCYLGQEPAGYGFVFNFPQNKVISFSELKNGVAIRHYDEAMKGFKQDVIPDNTPPYMILRSFGDYVVILGSGEEKENDKGLAILQFLDKKGVEVLRKEWPLSGKHHRWGRKTMLQTPDSAFLIVCLNEICAPDVPTPVDPPINKRVMVFNRSLDMVYEGDIDLFSVYVEDDAVGLQKYYFTKDHRFILCGLEKIDKLLHATVYEMDVTIKKPKCIFDVPLSSKPYPPSHSIYMFTKLCNDGQLTITCLARSQDKTTDISIGSTNIFSTGFRFVKHIPLDKAFDETYPQFGKGHKEFPGTIKIMPLDDGVLLCGEYCSLTGSYALRNINFIKIDSKGEIAWIKTIERSHTVIEDYLYEFAVYPYQDRFVFYYLDNPGKFVAKSSKPSPPGIAVTPGVVQAFIDADGNITDSKLIYNNQQAKITMMPSSMLHVNDNTFLVFSKSLGKNAFAVYKIQ